MQFRSMMIALAIAVGLSGAAHAHSKKKTTVPADGATVSQVDKIAMGFDAPMRITAIKLLRDGDEQGLTRETGMEPVTRFHAKPSTPLQPGAYSVEWRGLSDDGHPMQGSFAFTVSD